MATTISVPVKDNNPVAALQGFLKTLLAEEIVTGILVPRCMEASGVVMPSLVTDPARLDQADPLAPSFPLNAARVAARLTHGEPEGMVAAVLRPCEIRAFIELVKLNQGSLDDLLLIGVDCLGAFSNSDYRAYASGKGVLESTLSFLAAHDADGRPKAPLGLAKACLACEHPSPEGADLVVELLGLDLTRELRVASFTPRGEGLLNRLRQPDAGENQRRKAALSALAEDRIAYRDAMFAETAAATSNLPKLAAYLSGCVNCYNCRVACPVCYCRECVFLTDVFDYKPWQYMGWAKHKGAIKLPADTVFYHLTRMAHMSASCVGCGQCSNACPNNVPVMELFRMVADGTQRIFDYAAGRSVSEAPPLSVFREKEFSEVTGGTD